MYLLLLPIMYFGVLKSERGTETKVIGKDEKRSQKRNGNLLPQPQSKNLISTATRQMQLSIPGLQVLQ